MKKSSIPENTLITIQTQHYCSTHANYTYWIWSWLIINYCPSWSMASNPYVELTHFSKVETWPQYPNLLETRTLANTKETLTVIRPLCNGYLSWRHSISPRHIPHVSSHSIPCLEYHKTQASYTRTANPHHPVLFNCNLHKLLILPT